MNRYIAMGILIAGVLVITTGAILAVSPAARAKVGIKILTVPEGVAVAFERDAARLDSMELRLKPIIDQYNQTREAVIAEKKAMFIAAGVTEAEYDLDLVRRTFVKKPAAKVEVKK